jgi:ketosteroid isomerase-like protein
MVWDDDNFHIAAQLDEPHVWATLAKHDAVIFHDNDFEVFIDPNGDNHEYFELELNALNTAWDLFLPKPYKDGGTADNSFEFAGMKTAVHVQGTINDPRDKDEGWSVEIAIPWSAMRKHARRPLPPRHGDYWRVNFSRVEWEHEIRDGKYEKAAGKREDNWIWSPPGIVDMHRPERWGIVQFSTDKPGATKFVPPPELAARDVLMEIYHRQKAHHAKHKRWAGTLAELGLVAVDKAKFPESPTLEVTGDGFLATLGVTLPGEKLQRWHTRHDSRLWTSDSSDEQIAAIEAVLYDQADAWNRGDIDAFMEGYWKSDALSFSSGGKTTRGWQATRDGYKTRYPTRDAMGSLKFSQLEISPIGNDGALVLGNWRLERGEPVGGNFSLVMRKIGGKWVIVHDHTSRAATE